VLSPRVLKRNLLIAALVGSLLSLVNQYDVLRGASFTSPLFVKLLFNYLIPFAVSSLSAAVNRNHC
jgi:hypothetical protein